jgi:uncharacterized RDD family membrane protein YckC
LGPIKKPKLLFGREVCRRCRDKYISRRQAAYLIDAVIYQIGFTLVTLALMSALGTRLIGGPGPGAATTGLVEALDMLLGYLVFPLIFALKEAIAGKSPGKALLGLQVVDSTTFEPIGAWQSFKRNLPLFIPLIGVLTCLFTMYKGRRWGDGWANTKVLWLKRAHRVPFAADDRLCIGCGYDLTGNTSGICPECGRPVDKQSLIAQPA